MELEESRLLKCAFEARFNASLLYHDKRKELFHGLTQKFPSIRIGSDVIEVRNDDKYFKIFSNWNRAGGSIENVTNFSNFRDEIGNFLPKLCETYQVKRMIRIGVRFFFISPSVNSYDSLKKELMKLCYQQNVIKAFGDAYQDMALVLNYGDGDNSYSIRMGMVQGDEIKNKCQIETDFKNIPEKGLLFDIDYFNISTETQNFRKFISNGHTLAEDKIDKFLDLLKG